MYHVYLVFVYMYLTYVHTHSSKFPTTANVSTNIHFSSSNRIAALAISNAPSCVLLPPIKPLLCTNTHPSIPINVLNSSSRNALHGVGNAFLDAKDPGAAGTARTRAPPELSGNKQYLKRPTYQACCCNKEKEKQWKQSAHTRHRQKKERKRRHERLVSPYHVVLFFQIKQMVDPRTIFS